MQGNNSKLFAAGEDGTGLAVYTEETVDGRRRVKVGSGLLVDISANGQVDVRLRAGGQVVQMTLAEFRNLGLALDVADFTWDNLLESFNLHREA